MEQKVLVASRSLYHPKQDFEISKDAKQSLKNNTVCEASTNVESKDWLFPFVDFIIYDILPKDLREATFIKRRVDQFFYVAVTKQLYRRSYDVILLCCLS